MKELSKIKHLCPKCFGPIAKAASGCFVCGVAETTNLRSEIPSALPLRTVLVGRYVVGKPLGAGGFGVTYLAYDLKDDRKVAIKEFFPKGFTMRSTGGNHVTLINKEHGEAFNHWLKAFVKEAQILISIKHLKGVVRFFDFFQTRSTAYIVMDYLEGVSLRAYLNNYNGKINLQRTKNIMRPVLDSLFALHQYGVIHKDISPENILIVDNKYVKLIDFGAASIYTQKTDKPYIVLKAGFSPIELYTSSVPQGPYSDVYQIGATIYNCLCGAIPPPASERLNNDRMLRPSQYGVQMPAILENCLLKSLAVKPKDRYDNMGTFIQIFYGEFNLPTLKSRPYS
ncbi:MAG: serine/threonine protein kinase [Firmicutes bacterium]|nr:serine/threonine protein kinase [Bacillota bacterium]